MRVDVIYGAIGRFSVRFRWLVLLIWIAGAIAASTQLPSLSSVTQSSNQAFLPANAPSSQAATLAKPFGTANQQPIPVVVATTAGKLTSADVAAISGLQARIGNVSGITKVVSAGRSTDGEAEQLVALASAAGGGNLDYAKNLVDGIRAQITDARLPAGLQAHTAGDLATQVDQQKASGSTGNKVQSLSVLFVIVLLVLIFRSFTLAITTVLPAALSVSIAGPLVGEAAKHGLQVSPIAQLLLIVLVIGAGTDYGLFLVFRVREELRAVNHDTGGENFPGRSNAGRSMLSDLAHPRPGAREAIVRSVTRVGESISASALTVIAAVLTLLLASFPFYSDLAWPFAIAVGVILLAGLTLLPALLSIRLSLLAVKRTLFRSWFGRPKLIPWSIQGSGKTGVWGRVAGRIVQRPAAVLAVGVVFFGGLSVAVIGYSAAGFGGNTSPPAGSDSAAGTALLAKHFPQSAANPTNPIFKFAKPVCADPAPLAKATSELQASKLFNQVTGPLNPVGGVTLTSSQYAGLCGALGPASKLPVTPTKAALDHGRIPAQAYQLYRATANFVSPDGKTVQFSTGLKAGDPGSTAAMNAVPAIRATTTAIQKSVGAEASGVGGEAPALYDISHVSVSDLQRIIPVAIVVIGLLLALVLRSLVAPLYLIASVGVSYLAALGLSVLIFIKLGHSDGLEFFMPFLMFIFLLALGEDYNILVMTRIREEAHHLPLRQAVAKAVGVTGTTVTSAGLVLAGSFIVLTIAAGSGAQASQVRDIGLGLALGILMDTFLVRTLLVPSTVVLLGRWNWWPSTLHIDEPPAGDRPAGEVAPVTGDVR
ncbi:MAG TPA: MMPL family transporter [Streptosporangiaceae bacterium]|nr:MMPL family transporter [Streptosporangiaceae bacterium]